MNALELANLTQCLQALERFNRELARATGESEPIINIVLTERAAKSLQRVAARSGAELSNKIKGVT